MSERPILFSAPMVRALLAGTKTQTRRVLRPQPLGGVPELAQYLVAHGHYRWHSDECEEGEAWKCPYGQPGDRLWVREAWRILGDSPDDTLDMFDRDDVQYRADDDQSYIDKYRPSIHMPRRFSRITLEVAGVRVERLQDISEADAIAEGIHKPAGSQFWHSDFNTQLPGDTPQWAYRNLWESINGHGSWDANPWVWCVSFRRITP